MCLNAQIPSLGPSESWKAIIASKISKAKGRDKKKKNSYVSSIVKKTPPVFFGLTWLLEFSFR